MEKVIRLTLVGAALGLSVSTFATFVVQDYTAGKAIGPTIFDQLYAPYLVLLAHYFGYLIRFILVGNIKNYELFGRHFSRENTLYTATICLDYLSILVAVGAATFVFVPEKYILFISVASLVSFASTMFDLNFRLQGKYRTRPIGRLLRNRAGISLLEFATILVVIAPHIINPWYAIPFYLILLIADFVLCRALYFEDYEKTYDELFSVDDATSFYERIAPIYDRNIHEAVRLTQASVVSIINDYFRFLPANRALKILDLGGGTGEICKHFAGQSVEWTNVDASRCMLDIFNAKSRQLRMNVSSVHLTAQEFVSTCQQTYDLVLATFVLTALPASPEWDLVARIMAPNAKLIVADINPLHTVKRPFFEVEQNEKIVAIECRPVNLAALLNNTEAAGLRMVRLQEAPHSGSEYAFTAVFENGGADTHR